MRRLLALILAASPALADPPLIAEEFEALTLDKTLEWTANGHVFATEHYLPGRKLRWSYPDDTCQIGSWYPDGTAICFNYEAGAGTVCWQMTATDGGLLAHMTANPPEAPPVTVRFVEQPLVCGDQGAGS
jgi:hypothetical protein